MTISGKHKSQTCGGRGFSERTRGRDEAVGKVHGLKKITTGTRENTIRNDDAAVGVAIDHAITDIWKRSGKL